MISENHFLTAFFCCGISDYYPFTIKTLEKSKLKGLSVAKENFTALFQEMGLPQQNM
jgi:hypothetical protein